MPNQATEESNNRAESYQIAQACLSLGLHPVPLADRSKAALIDYTTLRITAENLETHFPRGELRNIGFLLGTLPLPITDVDLDCPEATMIAPIILPRSGWVIGRLSAPSSHWLYRTDEIDQVNKKSYQDMDGSMICELRTDGFVIIPQSTHEETGEIIRWECNTDSTTIAPDVLVQSVAEIASAVLLARHWPGKGGRQYAHMALSGALLRAGWEPDRVRKFVHAVAVATLDEEAAKRISIVASTDRNARADRNTTGWPTLASQLTAGADVIGRVRDWLGIVDRVPATVASITPPPRPWPRSAGEEAYRGLAGDVTRLIDPATEADKFAILLQFLTAFGNVIGRSARYQVEATPHCCNLYTVLVGETAKARKGTSWGWVLRLFEAADVDWAVSRVMGGVSSGEGLIWAVRDPIRRRERVPRSRPARYEEIEVDSGIADKRLLVFESEFANVLKVCERSGNTLSPIIRTAWDQDRLQSMTKNCPARSTGAHISIVGHITELELRSLLPDVECGNGFGNRFLWACVRRSKLLPEPVRVDETEFSECCNRLRRIVSFARQAGCFARDAEARALWAELYPSLSEGKTGLSGKLCSRSEAQVVRLSLVYALLDEATLVRPEHLMAALAVWEYCQNSVEYLFGRALGNPLADDLMHLLRVNPAGVTRTEMHTAFGRHQRAQTITEALHFLQRERLARCEQVETGGRPSERWFAIQEAAHE